MHGLQSAREAKLENFLTDQVVYGLVVGRVSASTAQGILQFRRSLDGGVSSKTFSDVPAHWKLTFISKGGHCSATPPIQTLCTGEVHANGGDWVLESVLVSDHKERSDSEGHPNCRGIVELCVVQEREATSVPKCVLRSSDSHS